ncbi:MAG: DUF4446 family protein [Armatimonadia bacterium]
MQSFLNWLPLGLSALAAILGGVALWQSQKARALATPTSEMRRLAERLAQPEGEQLLATLLAQVQGQETRLRDLDATAESLKLQLRDAVQRIGLQRFNSDEVIGGNLSFALAMLDSRNHGLMLTSIHSLESCRIFLRPIINGESEMPLMPEEQTALQQALRS